MNIYQSLKVAARELNPITDSSTLEAEILLAHVLKKPRGFLHARPETELTHEEQQHFAEYVKRRCQKEPVAYMLGVCEFWSLELVVTQDTLIPRPETELLVECALNIAKRFSSETIKIADLGTGSGAIALALAHAHPQCEIYASDISENALQIARQNAARLALSQVTFYQGDWCAALPDVSCYFDIIVSNPPYIAETEWPAYASELAYEPRSALVGGVEGLDDIRTIIRSAKPRLKSGGYVIIEHGFAQAEALRTIFAAAGYNEIKTIKDLSGQERVTLGRYTHALT